MRLLILLFALLAVTVSTATPFKCGPKMCGPGQTCEFDCVTNQYQCVYKCDYVTVTQKVVSSWADNNGQIPYVQLEVTVTNHGPRVVKDVLMGTSGMNLKDGNAIWSVDRIGSDLSLPSYVSQLAVGQSHKFGYINKGTQAAYIYVKNVQLV
ncbi:hypothetical protein DFA_10219 [Cavenderia fasciculata]|uniref:Carbohydrate binding domain-containing protein n=1 Tax=Cavenderia fasciculata TaxID=261658 RepID=F4Q9L6_CACFS|nr:uncharacterized protein DFA_10219 [Cavenderia fasciculata]EGG15385.1 hypothetical protein DFA_10219 [Cavenderia fasciculata]|eukprot:XP_004354127.1 hypothetical protein DFA_10219 [Cavenderia fasciculata]